MLEGVHVVTDEQPLGRTYGLFTGNMGRETPGKRVGERTELRIEEHTWE